MLTLRQIEVVRAIMVTGTIAGAAKLLNVSAPGISRLMKYTEDSLGVRLFNRRHGRFVPTPEARNIFDLLDSIHRKVEDLQVAIGRLGSGDGRALSFASVPSIANVMVPRAVAKPAVTQRLNDAARLGLKTQTGEEMALAQVSIQLRYLRFQADTAKAPVTSQGIVA